MTMQDRFSALTASQGHFQKQRGLDENRVSLSPPMLLISMLPWNEVFGSWIRQSPQICCAFHCHASIRSEAGTSSVENSCDIVFPSRPRLTAVRVPTHATRADLSLDSLRWVLGQLRRNASTQERRAQYQSSHINIAPQWPPGVVHSTEKTGPPRNE